MTGIPLTDKETWTLINALHTASESYQRYAQIAQYEGHHRIADQFLLQVTEAQLLADRLQQAEGLELRTEKIPGS